MNATQHERHPETRSPVIFNHSQDDFELAGVFPGKVPNASDILATIRGRDV